MGAVNTVLTRIFDVVLHPFRDVSPLWSLSLLALLTGLFMLAIFRYTSNQAAIARVKNRLKAHFLEFRLFQDDFGLLMQAQKDILKHNLVYLMHALRPMAVMVIPMLLLLGQLNVRYGYRPLRPGEMTIVAVTLRQALTTTDKITLQAPQGVMLETQPLRIPQLREVDWRLRPTASGQFWLRIQVGEEAVGTWLTVSNQLVRVAPYITQAGFMQQVLQPADHALSAASLVQAIAVYYPPRQLQIWGWNMHWLVFFFVVSLLCGFALKNRLGVEV